MPFLVRISETSNMDGIINTQQRPVMPTEQQQIKPRTKHVNLIFTVEEYALARRLWAEVADVDEIFSRWAAKFLVRQFTEFDQENHIPNEMWNEILEHVKKKNPKVEKDTSHRKAAHSA